MTLSEGRCSPGWSPVPSSTRRVTTRPSRKIVGSFVLAQMLDKGFIDQRQHDAAMTEPLRLAAAVEPQGQLAPEVIELVKRTLKEAVGETQERRLHHHDHHRSQDASGGSKSGARQLG